MTADRWQQIEVLYHAVIEQPEENRGACLDSACTDDPELRREVESLIERDRAGVFDRPAWEALIEDGAATARPAALQPGMELGSYRIQGPIGAGGMGEVYRARDTKLDRDTAIKVLPAALAQDAGRLARFEREAKILASLNHPNIAQIYGVEDSSGIRALAMELVPGEAIKGPVPVETAIAWARQLASALEAAHERGVIHRDLKPANILVTPEGVVKVLDFGLARPTATDGNPKTSHTRAGVILGTAGYMAPEQARGKSLDKRVDIWAFGVVLYEISTGKRLFAGDSVSDILAGVLTKEPDLSAVPAKLRRLVRACLEKDPKNRLRDIGDWAAYLEDFPAPPASSKSRMGVSLAWVVAVGVIVATGLAAFLLKGRPAPQPEPLNIQLRLPPNVAMQATSDVVLSPDGKHAAFPANGSGGAHIYLQDFDGSEARAVAGTIISANSPPVFWSPDSRYVVYSEASARIARIEAATGAIEDVCEKPGPMIGGAWNRDGVIILGSTTTGLWRVQAGGKTPAPLTHLDTTRGETAHQLPMFLPDQKHFLYHANANDPSNAAIYVASLDEGPNTVPRRIVTTPVNARLVQDGEGHFRLLYFAAGSLVAQPFDPNQLTLTGAPQPLPLRVGTSYQTALFDVGRDVLVYRATAGSDERQLTWFDLASREVAGTAGEPGRLSLFARLSPDGTRLAYAKASSFGFDVWILDLARNVSTRLTFEGDKANSDDPVWSPDGRMVTFARNPTHTATGWQIFQKAADGSGSEELLLKTTESVRPLNWTKDGKFLLYEASNDAAFGMSHIGVLPMQKGAAPFLFSLPGTKFRESDGVFSPDGRFVAYESADTGRPTVYVRDFSPESTVQNGPRWLVSPDPGHAPAWSADGKKLYWRAINTISAIFEADVDTSHGFRAGAPHRIFDLPQTAGSEYVIVNRSRVLLPYPVNPRAGQAINVVFNWQARLK